jgi:transposase
MAKTYRPYVPEQVLLLPPSLRDWLPEDHLAFFVSDLIDQLDLSAITAVYEDEERGYPPYHPVMLTKVLVYAYCVGVFSSRKFSDDWSRVSRSACWRPATKQIFAPSPIFARRTCRR